MASLIIAVGATNILNQPVKGQTNIDICKLAPEVCEGVQLKWWKWWEDCPMCGLFDWEDLLTIPENQSFSVSVKHGPISDTIMIELPKALSGAMLNRSTTLNPQPLPP
jgi:hypothetical protein